jgi:gliding motility-associated-like protein
MLNWSRWRYLLLVLLAVGCLGERVAAQATIQQIFPAGPTYYANQLIKIVGTNVFDRNDTNCDSLVFELQGPGTTYAFQSNQLSTPFDYDGYDDTSFGSFNDTIYWTIPCTWPSGTYKVFVLDDENCNACTPAPGRIGCQWDNTTITIVGGVIPNLAYGDSTFCVGETGVGPTIAMGLGTFLDVTSLNALDNMVTSPTMGNLVFHSGVVGTHKIRFTSSNTCSTKDSTFITVKVNQFDTLDYVGNPFCKSLASVPAPTHTATGLVGTYASSPMMVGLNASDGSDTIKPTTLAGVYTVTFTPTVNSCSYPTTTVMQIINRDSAIFQYAPTYCEGDAAGGYPTSVLFLPAGGGYFKDTLNFLDVDSLTGKIDLTQPGIVGTHTIGYYPNLGSCAKVKTVTFLIRAPFPAAFNIRDTSLCANSGILNLQPTTPGVFKSPSGDIYFQDTVLGLVNTDSSNSGGPFTIYLTNGDPTCPDTTQGHITLTPSVIPAFSYGSTTFCENGTDPAPFFTAGVLGGTFFAPPLGSGDTMFVNSMTGVIQLALSDTGQYAIIYVTPPGACTSTDTLFGVKILSSPSDTFNFPVDSICKNTGFRTFSPQASGGTADVWRLADINGNTIVGGMVGDSLNTNVVPLGGQYAIIRTSTRAICTDSFIDYITVLGRENAAFAYAPDTFCGIDQNPIPVIFFYGGGFFSNGDTTNNLVFDSIAVGMVDLFASSPGDQVIQYITPGFCPDTSQFSIYIRDALNPSFTYSRYNFCATDTLLLLASYNDTIFDTNVVRFSCMPPNPALDTLDGSLEIGTLAPGSYLITMSLINPQQACQDSFSRLVTISPEDADTTALLEYTPDRYCTSDSFATPNLVTQVYDGVFYSSPNFLVWDDRTIGKIDINHSPPYDYLIKYVKQNACQDVLSDSVFIGVPSNPVLTFYASPTDTVFSKTDFCKSDTIPPFPILRPSKPGVFSAVNLQFQNVLLVFTDSINGVIDLNATPAGIYRITFRESNGCIGRGEQIIRINAGPTVDLYLEPSDTLCVGDMIGVNVSVFTDYDIFLDGVIKKSDSSWTTSALRDGQVVSARVTDEFGCITIAKDTVKVWPIPDGSVINAPGTISGLDSIKFSMGTNVLNTHFSWTAMTEGSVLISPVAGTTDTIDFTETITIAVQDSLKSSFTPGTVTFLIVPKSEICTGETDKVIVRINPSNTAIFIPEVFTPNPEEDDDNSTWQIQWRNDIRKEDYEIYIYNRSGGQVDYLPELTDLWAGDGLPDGVYWYKIQSKLGSLVAKGAVTIRRK